MIVRCESLGGGGGGEECRHPVSDDTFQITELLAMQLFGDNCGGNMFLQ